MKTNGEVWARKSMVDRESTPSKKQIRPAATLLIVRNGTLHNLEVLALKRSQFMRFLPGFLAFPGGSLDSSDRELSQSSWTGSILASEHDDDVAYGVGAIRECAEEVGWLCASAAPGDAGVEDITSITAVEQSQLLAEQMTLERLLSSKGQRLNLSSLRFVGRWVTPNYMPARFDTRFFLILAHAQTPAVRVLGTENEWVRWCSPSELLTDIRAGKEQAVPPTIAMLEALAACASAEECFDRLHVPGPTDEDELL